MSLLNLEALAAYVEQELEVFHASRLQQLDDMNLDDVLKRKNPYLYKAKYVGTAEELVRMLLEAYLSSKEETQFGRFMEKIAIWICQQVYDGYKAEESLGVDLIFQREATLYLIEIKSGPYWGNSSQIRDLKVKFADVREKLQPDYPDLQLVAVNGCVYGRERRSYKENGDYYKLCGQDFWRFISGSDTLYTDIIEPLGTQARRHSDEYIAAVKKKITRFTREIDTRFFEEDGSINWTRLVEYVSSHDPKYGYPFPD